MTIWEFLDRLQYSYHHLPLKLDLQSIWICLEFHGHWIHACPACPIQRTHLVVCLLYYQDKLVNMIQPLLIMSTTDFRFYRDVLRLDTELTKIIRASDQANKIPFGHSDDRLGLGTQDYWHRTQACQFDDFKSLLIFLPEWNINQVNKQCDDKENYWNY